MAAEEKKKSTPFTTGNKWRFEQGNDAAKRVTRKQLYKQIDNLLLFNEENLNCIEHDPSSPMLVRRLAQALLSGTLIEISELLKSIEYGRIQT